MSPYGDMNGNVNAVAKGPNGVIYAGGSFTTADGTSANRVAKYDPAIGAWTSLGTGMDSDVYALAVDGSGNVYAGGSFTTAGGTSVNRVAKWNGTTWSALGTGLNNPVYALTFGPDGALYVGGWFSTAGGVTASRVAKYDPATGTWTPLGTGMNSGQVYALTTDASGNLYAGGGFTTAGDVANTKYIAKWNGSTWSALGTGMNNTVSALTVGPDGALYAGGTFSTAGGTSANRVAKWDGSTWTSLGTGTNNAVRALAVDGSGNLYAGGGFTTAGDVANTKYIAKWNGSTWSALGTGMNNYVYALAFGPDGALYVGGGFSTADGVTANCVAKWTSTPSAPAMPTITTAAGTNTQTTLAWTVSTGGSAITGYTVQYKPAASGTWATFSEGDNATTATITGLTNDTPYAFRVNATNTIGTSPWSATAYATPTPKAWSPFGTGMNSTVNAIAKGPNGVIYVGGWFSTAGGVTVNNIAKWDGSTWSSLGTGTNNGVNALAVGPDGALYAGGSFTTAGGVTVNRVAKWDGTTWTSLGTGVDYTVSALAVDAAGNLYAGGDFSTAGGVDIGYAIAKWNGSTWSALGTGVNNTVLALAVDGSGNLYAGGKFTTAGGTTVNRVAKYDPATGAWSALGTGMDDRVYALTVDAAGNLYAGGWFGSASGTSANRVAKWNGSTWTSLGTGMNYTVSALAVDASGNLYAGGNFTTAGDVANTKYIAKWNGTTWSALGTGVNSDVYALAVDGSGNLYAGGDFSTAGGVTVNRVAKWASPFLPVGISYPATADFTFGSDAVTVEPTVTEGDGSPTFAITTGTLPDGVAFDTSTGVFTGPTVAAWAGLTPAAGFPAIVTVTITDGTGSALAVLTLRSTPASPTGIDVVTGAGFADVSWTAPTLNGGSAVTDYTVEYRVAGSGSWAVFGDDVSTATSVTVTGLADATVYEFRVGAVNTAGVGPMSAAVEAETATVPGAPTGVAASGGNARVTLAWTAPANNGGSAITDYAVAYKTVSGSTWTVVDDAVSTGTSATVTGLTNNVSYMFRVAAVNAVGTSAWSVTADGKPRPDPWRPNPVTVNGGEMGGSIGGTTDVIVACTTDPIRIELSAPSPTDPSFGMPSVTVWNAGDNAQACAGGTLTVYAFNAAGDVLAQHTVPSLAVTDGAFNTGPLAWRNQAGVDTPIPMSQFKSVYVVIE